jgi:hypothetical protein
MPQDLRRFHHSSQSHFLTFSCYHRQPRFDTPDTCDLFVLTLEEMRRRLGMRIYGYVVMPEHVHLLVSEPADVCQVRAVPHVRVGSIDAVPQVRVRSVAANLGPPPTLAEGMHYLKLSFALIAGALIRE